MTWTGRVVIISIWVLLTTCALLGASRLKTNFSIDFFIPPGSNTDRFYQLDKEYFQTGFKTAIMVDNPLLDYASEDVQY